MKSESDPITADEFLIRLVWGQFFKATDPVPVKQRAFLPKSNETDGISVFRAACVANPEDVLAVIDPAKRDLYAIVQLPVAGLSSLGLSVAPDPIPQVAGHAVLPELNIVSCTADPRWSNVQQRLAILACNGVLRVPRP